MVENSLLKFCSVHRISHLWQNVCARTVSCYSTRTSSQYDVVISGGGMIGVATAAAIASSPKFSDKKILLLEASNFRSHDFTGKYSNRVSALSPAAKNLMTRIGAWEYVEKARFEKIKRMQVWDACSDAVISFSNSKDPNFNVAYTVENNLVVHSFLNVLKTLENKVDILDSTRVERYELPKTGKSTDKAKIILKNGETLTADLLIGADSWNSLVRNSMDINYMNWSYNQIGIVATVHFAEPTNNCVAWQRFLPDSTICILPLTDRLSSLIWCTSIPHAKKLLYMDEPSFVNAINEAFWSHEWKSSDVSSLVKSFSDFLNSSMKVNVSRQLPPSVVSIDEKSRSGFALSFGHATNYVSHRVALIGDAAHRIHPHAGQGANLGFADVECLVETMEEAVSCGADIGNLFYLMKYESKRQRRIFGLLGAVDGIHRLFKTDLKLVVLLRSLGLQSVDAMTPLKNYIMESTVQ